MKFKEYKFYHSNNSTDRSYAHWYDYIYYIEELKYYQDFQHDHYLTAKGITSHALIGRYFFMLVLSILVAYSAWVQPLAVLVCSHSFWVLLITMMAIGWSIHVVTNKECYQDTNLMVQHHLLYTLCLVGNVLQMLFYWMSLRNQELAKLQADRPRYVQVHAVHLVTGLCGFLNCYLTNSVLNRKFVNGVFWFTLLCLSAHCLDTKLTGRPVHKALDWNRPHSLLFACGILLGNTMLYIILCKIDELVKHGSLVQRYQRKLKYLSSGIGSKKRR